MSAQVARAGEPEDSKLAGLTIVYQAPDQCPGREVFQAALAARLNAPADTRRGRTLVDASFSLRARRITARVSLRDPAGGVRERSIEAETCREAIDALALITALALSPSRPSSRSMPSTRGARSRGSEGARVVTDRGAARTDGPDSARVAPDRAGTRDAEGPGERDGTSATAPAIESGAAGEPVAAANASDAKRALAKDSTAAAQSGQPELRAETSAQVRDESRTAPREEPAGPAPGSAAVSLFASGLLVTGIAPRFLPAVELGSELRLATRGGLDLSGRIAARFVPPGQVDRDQGSARFAFGGALLALCAGAKLGSSLAADGCGAFEAGAAFARGVDTRQPDSFSRPWLALGPALRVSWRVLAPFQLQAGVELLFPALRDRYRLAETIVHRVPWNVLRAGLSLSLQL